MITQHILPNISRSKGNQTVKFNHLMEYNKYHSLKKNHSRKVFLKPKKDLELVSLPHLLLGF